MIVAVTDATEASEDPRAEIARLREQVTRLSLFTDVGKALASSLDSQKVLQTIMEKISDLLEPDTWSLLLLDEERGELAFEIAVGEGSERLKDVRVKLGDGIAGWVAAHRQAVLVDDARSDPRFDPTFDSITGTVTLSIVCVPVMSRERVLGVIELVNHLGKNSFGHEDLMVLKNLADYAAIALSNAKFVQRINELTITDDCTQLYNARHLGFVMDAEIYRSARYGFDFSVLFLDLDRFKQVNDSHGHLAGSKLLWMIGELIRTHLRLIDYAFRYGGDEFVLVLPQTGKEAAVAVAERMRELLHSSRFLKDDGLNVAVTASFGVASYPVDGTTRKELLAKADEAMYSAKHAGRNAVAAASRAVVAEPPPEAAAAEPV